MLYQLERQQEENFELLVNDGEIEAEDNKQVCNQTHDWLLEILIYFLIC